MIIGIYGNRKGILMIFNKISAKFESVFLFAKNSGGLSHKKRVLYEIWNVALIILAPIILGVLSLSLAYGNYDSRIFLGYFTNPLVALLNLLPPLLLMLLLYGIIGKGWIAFAIDAFIMLGLTTANFYLLRFRDDPVVFSDLFLLREAADMGTKYDMTPTLKIVLCWLATVFITVILFFMQRKTVKFLHRIFIVPLVILLCIFPLTGVYTSLDIYSYKTNNFDYANEWSATQNYISKGFIYPFIYSVTEINPKKPEDYSEDKAKMILSEFEDSDIPEDKKVNVIAVMLEAFCDVTEMGVDKGLSPNVYYNYHNIRSQSIHGKIITDIFAGGTIDSERAFLTGYATLFDYRQDVNSFVRYFKDQGYYTEGSHPGNNWFYNRQNVNRYFGFDNYYFYEDYYKDKFTADSDWICSDAIMFPHILNLYREAKEKDKDKPYFAFHVTYQGHGPYNENEIIWPDDPMYLNYNIPRKSETIFCNYLSSVKNTWNNIVYMLDVLHNDDEPVVVLLFGDHKPGLGDMNVVYDDLGINLDTSTDDGFINYYSTEYVIWANPKAKEVLGSDFRGEQETISVNFLMNKLFEVCSWKGNAFMQYTDKVRETLPIIRTASLYDSSVTKVPFADTLTPEQLQTLKEYRLAEYYMSSFCE